MKTATAKATRVPAQPVKTLRSAAGRKPQVVVREATPTPDTTMEQIAAGKFKATCLQLLDRAAEGESIAITKRGKIVARLLPPESTKEKPFVSLLGLMKGKGEILGDIVSPDFEAWGMKDPYLKKKKK